MRARRSAILRAAGVGTERQGQGFAVSTSLHVYCIPLEALKRVPGSGDGASLQRIAEGSSREMAEIDAASQQCVQDEVYPYFLPVADAVRQIMEGAPLDREVGQVYVHAYELICSALAFERCGNWSPIADSEGWFEKLDAALKGHQATATLERLTCGGPVFPVPIVDCFPSPGWWPPGTIAQSHHALETRFGLVRRWFAGETDPEVAEALADIRGWLATAVRHPGSCLVGIHHF